MRWIACLALAAAMAFAPARAYTPEGGFWWNPQWSGVGLQLELQDDLLAASVYAYDQDGFPMWYTATGFLSDDATVFEADLLEYENGPCVGCPFQENSLVDDVGFIRIVFDPNDPTRATMTWGLDGGPQRTIPIERLHFYLHRPEDGSAPLEVTKMTGEWQAVIDIFDDPDVQYYGEVLVIDDFYQEDGVWFFEGCRPETSVDNFCTQQAFDNHPVVGFHDPGTGAHQIVVVDHFDQAANSDVCAVYDVLVGTDRFRGGEDGDLEPDDGGVAYYYCPQPDNSTVPYNGEYDFYPIEGFRTASRQNVFFGTGPGKDAVAKGRPGRSTGPTPKPSGEPDAQISTEKAAAAQRLRALEARLKAPSRKVRPSR